MDRRRQASPYPDIDQKITARLTETEAWRYQREHSRQALQQQLRAAQLAGHDLTWVQRTPASAPAVAHALAAGAR